MPALKNSQKTESNSSKRGAWNWLNSKQMVSFGRFAASLALLVVMPATLFTHARAAAPRIHRDPTLQEVTFKGIQNPDGRVLDDNTEIEVKVYDPKKPEATQSIAHAIGTGGATSFDVP